MSFPCNSCAIFFEFQQEQRDHYKSDFHLYNTKRRVVGLEPILQETWEERVSQLNQRMTEEASVQKGKNHLKHGTKPGSSSSGGKSVVKTPVEDEFTCLFDGKKFPTIEENLQYMQKKFSFFIPDAEFLTDLPGLLLRLGEKITVGNACLFCDRQFASIEAVRGHMLDLNHTRIGTDTDDLLDDIDEFYTFPEEDEQLPVILEDGSLQISASQIAIRREFAYIYKQRRRPSQIAPRDHQLNLRSKYLALLGGTANEVQQIPH